MTSAEAEWLWGWDPTPGIVSVHAEHDGRAVVWRRIELRGPLTEEQRRRLLQVADRCPVKQTLGHAIEIDAVA